MSTTINANQNVITPNNNYEFEIKGEAAQDAQLKADQFILASVNPQNNSSYLKNYEDIVLASDNDCKCNCSADDNCGVDFCTVDDICGKDDCQ